MAAPIATKGCCAMLSILEAAVFAHGAIERHCQIPVFDTVARFDLFQPRRMAADLVGDHGCPRFVAFRLRFRRLDLRAAFLLLRFLVRFRRLQDVMRQFATPFLVRRQRLIESSHLCGRERVVRRSAAGQFFDTMEID